MEWNDFEIKKPNNFENVLVIKQYLDAPYGENGYETEKSFWTDPIIMIDNYWNGGWGNGGRVTHWMKLPELPSGMD